MLAEVNPFINSLQHIVGFVFVLVALGFLWGLTALLGMYFKRLPQPAAIGAKPAPAAAPGQPSDEEIVAISAAVTMLMGQRSRIVSVGSSKQDWSREGRREHFASHRIR